MRLRLLVAAVVLPLLLWAALPVLSSGQQARLSSLQKKIETKRGQIGRKKGTEKVLSSEIAGYSARIGRLERRIGGLRERESRIQSDLDRKRAQLEATQADLRAERRRLTRLREKLAHARVVLADRLLELYQSDRPDLVTVVLNAKGFADLLERTEFLERIREQDQKVIDAVRLAKADATATAAKLDRLERRQQRLAAIVLARRNEVNAVKQDLIDTRVGYASTRSDKRQALTKVRGDRHELEEDLESLEKASAAAAAKLRAVQGGAGLPAGPVRRGSGSMVWPVNGSITGVFGEARPGHMHAGLDIAAPEGTPIRAADSGKVVLMQGIGASGGYGLFTCVAHSASLATCYAHQSRFGTSQGANVSKGQVIGYVGNTGHSFGAHLHFEVRVNGSPVNPMGYL
ncbi:murein hydrolase activator EnvC [Conexibacter sp. SYSU D00693]|uniref:murein hydrolase activator EnvC family protein n=1 Tax=Conexibacter sp. SYSU D00693 TaxID=2812560 RepID=UPI00196A7465|nr:M23 family metallopeptidase [Conexibacter sp. SYSU D00693]